MAERIKNWLAVRMPHVEKSTGNLATWRLYGFKPYNRLCIFDYTRGQFHTGRPAWTRIRLFGLVLFERNHQYSGLPHG